MKELPEKIIQDYTCRQSEQQASLFKILDEKFPYIQLLKKTHKTTAKTKVF